MLVLTRKAMETIKIGDNIVLKVICTGTKTVRIGIEAPGDVRILRGELTEYPPASVACTLRVQSMPAHGGCGPQTADFVPPFVADAVTDMELVAETVVVGPMTADKFLAEFSGEMLPGRSIRRMVKTQRSAANVAAK